ncbi:MAG: hypothetical protein ACI8ZW_000432, partial [Yoonia sp.]
NLRKHYAFAVCASTAPLPLIQLSTCNEDMSLPGQTFILARIMICDLSTQHIRQSRMSRGTVHKL